MERSDSLVCHQLDEIAMVDLLLALLVGTANRFLLVCPDGQLSQLHHVWDIDPRSNHLDRAFQGTRRADKAR